ncbi:NUDIX domain-containing protein [Brachybacterium sp. YJGR34]|uniref:NUDIX domain-containing protein n=1 Tax=Brachybacterium sp. YJGR34 TaxID=2059911 RepID=UPI000E0BB119|nr:NUDIX domain-containing protein [Brachybacterium sp. YJGR34]
MSDYVASLRSRIGNDLLLLPGVTAVIREGDRYLLARHRDSDPWSLIGGGVEPGEEPADALVREVVEEIGAEIRIRGIVGAYGGPPMTVTYPNGHQVGYVTVAYDCELLTAARPDQDEVSQLGWFPQSAIASLPRQTWIDRVIDDAALPQPRR